MNKCINLKQGFNKLKCKKHNKEITFADCKNCEFKEYVVKEYKKLQSNTKLKQKTAKQVKLERERFSLFTDNLEKCFLCPNPKEHMHEVFCGRNKANSMRYGLCLPICGVCHSKYQNDAEFNDYWHKKGQASFKTAYPNIKFIDIFRRNYL